jgi:hypothetical protein
MPNAYRVRVGDHVHYRLASGLWVPAVVTAVTSQTAVKLARPRHTSDPNYATTPLSAAIGAAGQMTQVNTNLNVNRYSPSSPAATNVWRRY